MFDELVRRWWIVAARGAVSVAFAVAAFVAPDATRTWLISLFGLFALADGLFTMGAGLSVSWLTLFLEGFVGAAVGVVTLFAPISFTEYWLVVNIGLYAVVTGGIELAGAMNLAKRARGTMVRGDRLLGLNGAVSLVFGAILLFNTTVEPPVLMRMLGAFALTEETRSSEGRKPQIVPPPAARPKSLTQQNSKSAFGSERMNFMLQVDARTGMPTRTGALRKRRFSASREAADQSFSA